MENNQNKMNQQNNQQSKEQQTNNQNQNKNQKDQNHLQTGVIVGFTGHGVSPLY